MAIEVLIIFDVFKLPDGKRVIGLNTEREQLRDHWRSMDTKRLKTQFEGKTIQVYGEDYRFETSVLGVEINNSLADFKNVFLKLDNNAFTQKIRVNDHVEVDL